MCPAIDVKVPLFFFFLYSGEGKFEGFCCRCEKDLLSEMKLANQIGCTLIIKI